MTTLHTILTAAGDALAAPADPTPAPAVPGVSISGAGVMSFFAKVVIPIGLAIAAAVIIFRSKGGNMSQAVTTSGISVLGLAMFALAGSMAFLGLGDFIVSTITK